MYVLLVLASQGGLWPLAISPYWYIISIVERASDRCCWCRGVTKCTASKTSKLQISAVQLCIVSWRHTYHTVIPVLAMIRVRTWPCWYSSWSTMISCWLCPIGSNPFCRYSLYQRCRLTARLPLGDQPSRKTPHTKTSMMSPWRVNNRPSTDIFGLLLTSDRSRSIYL